MEHPLRMLACVLAVAWPWICGTPLRAQSAGAQERVVARAGDLFVSEREFVERFELLPALYRHRKSQIEASKLEFLYSIVAEKLLAQEAVDRKLDQDTMFLYAFLELRKLLARDQLYREEVTQQVTVSREELAKEREHAQRLAHVAFLFFDRKEDAEFVRGQIGSRGDYDRLNLDSSLAAVRDTATVIWGDADPVIEEAAFVLTPGEVSPVIGAGGGYYILRLITFLPGTASTRYPPEVFQEKLESRIRQRKEQRKMHEVIAKLLKGKIGYSRPGPFRVLAGALMDAMRAESTMTSDSVLVLTPRALEAARAGCGEALTDSLVQTGETRWTVEDVLDRLRAKRFQIERDKIGAIPATLNGELEYWTQQELLAQEGVRRGLDHRPEVERRLAMWRQAYLAGAMKRYAENRVAVGEPEVWEYLRSLDTSVSVPQVNLRVLSTSTLNEMQSAMVQLEDGADFGEVARTWSVDTSARANGGLTGYFPVTERPPLGSLAAAMETGERYGPVTVPGGFVLFEVAGKRPGTGDRDTTFLRRKEQAREEVVALKRQGLLNRFLAQVAQKRGVDVYADRLKAISVTSIPMMTFRILGFGGRMFEVPFVDPQLQWLNIKPPESPVLP